MSLLSLGDAVAFLGTTASLFYSKIEGPRPYPLVEENEGGTRSMGRGAGK